MIPKIVKAKYVQDFIIHLRFSDGIEGDVNLEQELEGEIFEQLKEVSYFKNFTFNSDIRTITWQNGADFAPEFLYEKMNVFVCSTN